MEWLFLEKWSPYIVGMCIGILSWLTFLLSDKALGCSSAFARTSGMIEKAFRGNKTLEKEYYKQFPPVIDWEWMLVAGVVIGAFISSKLSGQFNPEFVPGLWREHTGNTPLLRFLFAFAGGIVMGIGSRWAGGCTSGHGISGTLQLTVSSWIAALCFFIGGIVTAMFIFRVIF